MKFLFDQNLSPHLVEAEADLYPESVHVREVNLHRADDETVWNYAVQNGLTIVSKDADFHQRSFLYGHPPKVVWIQRGNCSTKDVESVLRKYHSELLAFEKNEEGSFLNLE